MTAIEETHLLKPKKRAMLLAALYIAQEQYGWLSPDAIKRVAERLELDPGQVHTTASFYGMFKLQPQGKYRIQVCEGLSCFLAGGLESIIDCIKKKLGIEPGETTPDGKFSFEIVQCLAACDFAPAIKINDQLYENISLDRIDVLINELQNMD
ncbi:MAG: NAD(P)H-dependent oxidoreductase subunit E [Anaerolineales bacterium]|nr:NAD(P)H-dependent oxidoreductase subunit E [Anaerolineales bacterium]